MGSAVVLQPRSVAEPTREHQFSLRVTNEDRALIDEVAALIPAASTSQVLRAALRLGLAALRADPAKVLTTPPPAVEGPPPAPPARSPRARKGRRET